MTAIGTDKLKARYSQLLYNEIVNAGDNNHYYIGIGKSDQYDSGDDTVVNPVRTLQEERDARYNLESITKVSESSMSFIVPRYNWSSGTQYSAWTDHQVGYPTNSYYVMTEDQQVYICLANSRNSDGSINPSTVKPDYSTSHTGDMRKAFKTADNYIWKFMYEITASRAAAFLSAAWMPIQYHDSSSATTTAENDQASIKKTNKDGQIVGVEIVDAGLGYSEAPALSIGGDGTGAVGTITMNGTSIGKIDMTCTVGDSGMGQNYTFGNITLTGGGTPSRPAVLRPIIGPRDGFGHDPRDDLKSTSLMFNVKPSGTENGHFSVETAGNWGGQSSFRQITLLRNITFLDSAADGNVFTFPATRMNRTVTLSTKPLIQKNEKITGSASKTVGWVDHIDSMGDGKLRIHYHWNTRRTDFFPSRFTSSDTITGATSSANGGVDSDSQPEYGEYRVSPYGIGLALADRDFGKVDRMSGEVLYIDNRTRVLRTETQTEDIKVIVTV